jgi:hypothetical protein
VTHCQALQVFPDVSQVSLHKTINSTQLFIAVPAGSRGVTVAFNFINERTVASETVNLLDVPFDSSDG